MTLEKKRHLRKRPNDKMLLNAAAIVAVLIIVLAIGVFIGKTLTMNSGSSVPTPIIKPGDNSNSFVLPSGMPTATPTSGPDVTVTPTPAPSLNPTITATPNSTASPTPTITSSPNPTPTPTPEPSFYPTMPPQATPTPTPSPQVDIAPDAPFYESITPLKPGDYLAPVSDQNAFIPGSGPIFVDLSQSDMGSDYAYPGDTIGVKLRLANQGPAIDTVSRVTLNLSKLYYTADGGTIWLDDIVSEQYYTKITIPAYGWTFKNISYQVPNNPNIKGVYKIYIKFYVNGQFTAGAIKVFNIM